MKVSALGPAYQESVRLALKLRKIAEGVHKGTVDIDTAEAVLRTIRSELSTTSRVVWRKKHPDQMTYKPDYKEQETYVTGSCGSEHMSEEPCCPSCAEGQPCECEEGDHSKEINDPFDYLDALEEQYEEMGVTRASIREALLALSGTTLEEYLDRRAALYQMEGAKKGVRYIDQIDEQREELEKAEEALSAALTVLGGRVPDDPEEALKLVLRDASRAHGLAKWGKFEKAQESLEAAIAKGQAIIQEEILRNAAVVAEEEARDSSYRRFSANTVQAIQSYGVRMKQALGSITDLSLFSKRLESQARRVAALDPRGESEDIAALEDIVFDIERTLNTVKDYMVGY